MKQLVLFLVSLVTYFTVTAQGDYPRYSKVAGFGFNYKRISQDSIALMPLATSPHTPYREGGYRYNGSDSTMELWTGYQWLKLSKSASTNLQAVTDAGNITTDTIIAAGIRTKVLLPDTTNSPDFEFIVLPDLQEAAQFQPDAIRSIRHYIIDNKVLNNTQAVLSVGDLTNTAVDAEYERVDSLFTSVDSMNVPSLPVIGNHDYDGGVVVGGVRNVTQWNKFFGIDFFSGKPWYGGQLGSSTENYYIKFDVGEYKFLTIALEFFPSDASLNWAQAVIDSNTDRKVIISTHGYMDAWGEKSTDDILLGPVSYGLSGDNAGKEMWEKLIRRNKNIIMVLGGHFVNFGASTGHFHRFTQAGDYGNMIHQIMINYQRHVTSPYLLGRDGYLLKMRFRPAEDKVYLSVYSPFIGTYDPQVDSFYINLNGIKVDGSLTIQNDLHVRDIVTLDSSVYIAKIPNGKYVVTRENGKLDSLPFQSANTVLAGPTTGSAANPTFRTLVLADIPSLSTLYIQNQTAADQVASFRINGTGIIGTSLGSTAKLHVNNGGNGVTSAFGPLLSNGINNTFHSIDTVTSANIGSLKTVLTQNQRDIRLSDNGLTVSLSSASTTGLVYRAKDNVTFTNVNGDRNNASSNTLFLRQFAGFTGVSIFNAPDDQKQALSAVFGRVDLLRSTPGRISARGNYSSFNAILNVLSEDTVYNYTAFNSGLGTFTGEIKKYTHVSIPAVPADTVYAINQTGTLDSSIFAGILRLPNLTAGTTADELMVSTSNGTVKKRSINLEADVFTPTVLGVINVDGVTVGDFDFIRMGNIVHWSGSVTVDATTTSTNTSISITLPFATTMTNLTNLKGGGHFGINGSGVVVSNSNIALYGFNAQGVGGEVHQIWGQYKIVP